MARKATKPEPPVWRFNVGDHIRDSDIKFICGTVVKQITFSRRLWPFYIIRRRDGSEEVISDLSAELAPKLNT